MSSSEILFFFFLTIREGCPGENCWIQGQLSGDFRGLGVLTSIIFNRVIFYLFSRGFFYYFLD